MYIGMVQVSRDYLVAVVYWKGLSPITNRLKVVDTHPDGNKGIEDVRGRQLYEYDDVKRKDLEK